MNKWELLAAMQALAVYVIVRMDEDDEDHHNVHNMLIRAVTVRFRQRDCRFSMTYAFLGHLSAYNGCQHGSISLCR